MKTPDGTQPASPPDRPGTATRAVSLTDALAFAMDRHGIGRLAEAEAIYRQILAKAPDHTETLHLLGVLLHQTARTDEAVELLREAIDAMPGEPRYHLSLGRLWLDRGQFAEAASSLQRAVDFGEESVETLNNLSVSLYQIDRFDQAASAGRRAVALAPDSAEARFNLGNALRSMGELEEAAVSYERALEIEPRLAIAQNALGSTYKLLNRSDRALECFQAALDLDPGNPDAKRSVRYLTSRLVPRWHFPMLNDERRNAAFDQAISRATKPGHVVLDIGTGTGLLAMMAARAGAQTVVACEAIAPVADVAERIVAANGLADRITVFAKRSTELSVGRELPRRADVVIAEILDAGLLGEGVLPILRHARQRLAARDAVLIPCAATVSAVLIESSALVERERVGTAAGFDIGLFNEFSLPQYTQRRLRDFDHRTLTRTFEVLHFDFSLNLPERGSRVVSVATTNEGVCHAVAFWFRLHLDDTTSLDTGPASPSSHWQQAVQLVDPVPVAAGQSVGVRASYEVDTIRFDLVGE